MSQGIWDKINPTTTSGTQLAALLNDFKDAVVSGFSGQNRPPNLQEGGYWVKSLDGAGDPQSVWDIIYYDGTKDIKAFSIDTANETIITGDISNDITVKKVSVDNIGPLVNLVKSRGSGVATAVSDVLGQIDFQGKDAGDIQYVQARIVSVSTDLVSSGAQGSYMAFEVTKTSTGALVEAMRVVNNGNIAIGQVVADKKIDILGNDATAALKVSRVQASLLAPQVILKKKRVANDGQVLSADEIGEHLFVSTDENGNEIEVAKITVKATQDHTGDNNGTEFIVSHKLDNQNTYTEAIKLNNGNATIYGKDPFAEGSDTDVPTVDLLDDTATRNLLTLDGQNYGSFEAKFMFFGRDNTNVKFKQVITIDGIYDANNTEWHYTLDEKVILGSSKLIKLDDASTVGKDLVIDYINQIASASFNNGRIYGKIRRFAI